MDAVRDVFRQVLHRRLVRNANVADAVWAAVGHWGLCGQSCPCCRSAVGEVFGTCDACDAAAQSLRVACTIASFIREGQSKRAVVCALTGSFCRCGRPLPQSEEHRCTAPIAKVAKRRRLGSEQEGAALHAEGEERRGTAANLRRTSWLLPRRSSRRASTVRHAERKSGATSKSVHGVWRIEPGWEGNALAGDCEHTESAGDPATIAEAEH